MTGGKKARKNSGRYFETFSPSGASSPRNVYCSDKRLVPRIKEYVRKTGECDVDELIANLQSTYPEYSRRKKHVFQNLVGKLYRSLGLDSSNQFSDDQTLEEAERRHFEKRMREANQDQDNGLEVSPVTSSSEDEDEEQLLLDMELSLDPEMRNSANSQLLQLYKSSARTTGEQGNMPRPVMAGEMGSLPRGSLSGGSAAQEVGAVPVLGIGAAAVHLVTTRGDNALEEAVVTDSQVNEQDLFDAVPVSGIGAAAVHLVTTRSDNEAVVKDSKVTRLEVESGSGCGPDDTGHVTSHSRAKKVKKRHHEGDQGGKGESATVKKRKVKEGGEGSGKDLPGQPRSAEFKVQTSAVRFSDVGGCEDALGEISKLLLHLRHPEVFSWLGVHPPQGFLLHGPPGCGKTLLAHAIAGELNLPFIKLASTEIVSGVSGESEGTLRDLFSLAKSHAPCILFVDEIDAICRKRETAQREMERRIVTQLLACLDDLNHSQVLVIGATSSPDSLDPSIRRAGRFDREISLGIPDQKARESILRVLGRGLRLETDFSFCSISRETPGFVGADLMALVREASLCAVNRVLSGFTSSNQFTLAGVQSDTGPVCRADGRGTGWLDRYSLLSEEELARVFISTEDFKEALKVVQPSAKREGFATVPDVTWDDVGALEAVREELSYAILAPVRYPDQFASLGLTSPPGVLLSGPPGCGKTLLAKAIANESGINFISVKGPELLNMYVGESERAVRQVFQRARNSAPCVIFFDELDALCPRRSNIAETSASSRVVNQLLTEMDGLVARKQVFIMGATNRPDIIDPAVLRPGRLDKILYVGLPSSEDRVAILNTITKFGTKPKLGDVDLRVLASDQNSKGYSGADLTAMVREAAIAALREHMRIGPLCHHSTQPGGLPEHLVTAQPEGTSLSEGASLSEPQGTTQPAQPLPSQPSPLPSQPSPQETTGPEGTVSAVKEEEEETVIPASGVVVEMRHFMVAISKIRPSVSEKDQLYYEQMAKKCTQL